MTTGPTPILLAERFSAILRDWLTDDELAAAIAANDLEVRDDDVCHSHDYCDANEAMAAAFVDVLGYEPVAFVDDDDTDLYLWTTAWDIAATTAFGMTRCPGCGQVITVDAGKTECGGRGEGICCVVADDDECDLHPEGHDPQLVAEAHAAHERAVAR